jgi:hypothetical protein
MVTEVYLLLLQLKNNVYVRNTDFGMLPLFESVIPQSNPIASKVMVVKLELLKNAPNIFSPNNSLYHSTEEEKYIYVYPYLHR